MFHRREIETKWQPYTVAYTYLLGEAVASFTKLKPDLRVDDEMLECPDEHEPVSHAMDKH